MKPGSFTESQTKPSQNCWAANKSGIPASTFCGAVRDLTMLTVPIVTSIDEEIKLAEAEKHMIQNNKSNSQKTKNPPEECGYTPEVVINTLNSS